MTTHYDIIVGAGSAGAVCSAHGCRRIPLVGVRSLIETGMLWTGGSAAVLVRYYVAEA